MASTVKSKSGTTVPEVVERQNRLIGTSSEAAVGTVPPLEPDAPDPGGPVNTTPLNAMWGMSV